FAWTPATHSPPEKIWSMPSIGSWPSRAGSTWCTATTRATSSVRHETATRRCERAPSSPTSWWQSAQPPTLPSSSKPIPAPKPTTSPGCEPSSASPTPTWRHIGFSGPSLTPICLHVGVGRGVGCVGRAVDVAEDEGDEQQYCGITDQDGAEKGLD